MPFDHQNTPLSPEQARVLATLMEKQRTVPDSYPMTLNSLLSGCNQKTSREPLMQLSESDALAALDTLRERALVVEVSGQRAMRWEHNTERVLGIPSQAAALLGLLLLWKLLPRFALTGYLALVYLTEVFNFSLSALRLRRVLRRSGAPSGGRRPCEGSEKCACRAAS